MKYLIFSVDNICTGVFDDEIENSVGFDYDPKKHWFPTLQLVDGVVVHTMPGITVVNQEKRFNAAKEEADFQNYKLMKVPSIKARAAELISNLDWKVTRATEQDQLAGTTDKVESVLQERQAIRDANNALEAALLACTTQAQVDALDFKNLGL